MNKLDVGANGVTEIEIYNPFERLYQNKKERGVGL